MSLVTPDRGGDTPNPEGQRLKFLVRRPQRQPKVPAEADALTVQPGLAPNADHPLAAYPAAELREAMIRDLARVLSQIAKRATGASNVDRPTG